MNGRSAQASTWRPPGAAGSAQQQHEEALAASKVLANMQQASLPQAHTLSSETLMSLYDPSSTDTSKPGSDVGSTQMALLHPHHSSEPALRSNGSSFTDVENAGTYNRQPARSVHHPEEDIFSTVGGLELGYDQLGDHHHHLTEASTSEAGLDAQMEPSRALFVRNLGTSFTDEDIHNMFKVFGDVRQVYTACKHRGFIMVTFYDLRSAVAAKDTLHGTVPGSRHSLNALHHAPLEVYYAVPKGDQTQNRGIVTVFNLDPDTTNEHLFWLFSKFGQVKDICESPDRSNQKFITFFDTRHAQAALQAMNKAEHLNKVPTNMLPQLAASVSQAHIQIPPHSLMELAAKVHRAPGAQSWDGGDGLRSISGAASPMPGSSPVSGHHFPEQVQHPPPMLPRYTPMDLNARLHVSDSASSMSSVATSASQLLQAAAAASRSSGLHVGSCPGAKLATLSEAQALESSLLQQTAAAQALLASQAANLGNQVDVNAAASLLMNLQLTSQAGGSGNGAGGGAGAAAGLVDPQLWSQLQALQGGGAAGQPNAGLYNATAVANAAALQNLRLQNQLATNLQELQARQQQQQQLALLASLTAQNASSLVQPPPQPGAMEIGAAALQLLQMAGLGQALPGAGGGAFGGMQNPAAALQGVAAAQQLLQQAAALGVLAGQHSHHGHGSGMGGSMHHHSRSSSNNSLNGGGHHGYSGGGHGSHSGRGDSGAGRGGRLSRRTTDPVAEAERKAQQERLYALDADKIRSGEDKRTTLMIKNIPNKYTQKMLLATIDEHFRGLYDFFYLPIDFKNKCNVGYAFINMINPIDIIPLTERFNQRKWERFNSEKVCHISYARIQGRTALVSHFQNSSLMHEDKRCRPILFTAGSEGEPAGEQEPFPVGPNAKPRISSSSGASGSHGNGSAGGLSGSGNGNGTSGSNAGHGALAVGNGGNAGVGGGLSGAGGAGGGSGGGSAGPSSGSLMQAPPRGSSGGSVDAAGAPGSSR